MKKKNTPAITHTEILARAYMSIEAEVNDWRQRIEAKGLDGSAFEIATEELRAKMDAIAVLYKMETGNDIR